MARHYIPFGEAPTDKQVMAWLEAKGIKHVEVQGYTIKRYANDIPIIEITMMLDEPAVAGDKEE